MSEFELQKIAELEKEIEKWRQQQKEDYATYLQKVEELQKTIVDSEVIFERNNSFSHKRILELEAKIETANKILEPKITAQQHLIESGSNTAVYALYFTKQELMNLEASFSNGPAIKYSATVEEGSVAFLKAFLNKLEKSSVANEKSIR